MASPRHRPSRSDSVVALSEGQRIALAQLRRIADTDRSPIRIVGVDDDPAPGASLNVDISLDCTHYQRVEEGLPLHDREGITLSLPADFPFSPPSVDTAHTRFHGFGHVQWGHRLCIYLSTETQWFPSQGMSGFLAQLDEWFSTRSPKSARPSRRSFAPASCLSGCLNIDLRERRHPGPRHLAMVRRGSTHPAQARPSPRQRLAAHTNGPERSAVRANGVAEFRASVRVPPHCPSLARLPGEQGGAGLSPPRSPDARLGADPRRRAALRRNRCTITRRCRRSHTTKPAPHVLGNRSGRRRQAARSFHRLPIQQPLQGTRHPGGDPGVDRLHSRNLDHVAERSPCAVVPRN